MTELDSTKLLALRTLIPQAEVNPNTSASEAFQNQTLRPIIKFLNLHILSLIKHQLSAYGKDFVTIGEAKKIEKIRTFLDKNQKIRYNLCGLIMGLMTEREIDIYLQSSNEYNKRIIQMIEQRTIDHIDYFK